MRIEYVASKSQREVSDSIGKTLIARKIARPVYQTRAMEPDPVSVIASEVSAAINAAEDAELTGAEEISPRTGKPKRRYKRRDMKAEE